MVTYYRHYICNIDRVDDCVVVDGTMEAVAAECMESWD